MSKEELLERMIDEVMEAFDFKRVHEVMSILDWKWKILEEEKVPNMYRIMNTAVSLLRQAATHYGDKESYSCGIGGFMASIDNGSLTLQFVLEERTSDHRDYIHVEEE